MKKLSFSQADKEQMLKEFTSQLNAFKSNQDKFVYEKKFTDLTKIDQTQIKKPVIYFAMEAWLKMQQLVAHCDKEIAWQATVEKRKYKDKEDSDDFYYFVKQVFVYPQKVTGAFVDVDTVKYAEWSLQLDDNTYNTLRFQGHSHVNMAVGPSGTDLNTYQNFLEQLDKDDYYIFMILNKRNEYNIMVYDYAQDILFETADCYVDILTSQGSMNRWVEENMKQVEFKVETPHYATANYGWEDWYDRYDRKNTSSTRGTQLPVQEKKGVITFINERGYMQDRLWYPFNSFTDLVEFFEKNPNLFATASITPETREKVKVRLENKKQKKRGRPAKGEKTHES